MDNQSRRSSWTPAEDGIIFDLHQELGDQWSTIARYLPGRSEQAIKTRWHTTSKRQQEKNKQLSKAITRFNKHAAHEFLTSKGNKLHHERSVDGNGTDNSTIEFLASSDSVSTMDMDPLVQGVDMLSSECESGFDELSSLNMMSLCTSSDAAVSVSLQHYNNKKSCSVVPDLTTLDSSVMNYTVSDVEHSRMRTSFRKHDMRKKTTTVTPRILRSRQKKTYSFDSWKDDEFVNKISALSRQLDFGVDVQSHVPFSNVSVQSDVDTDPYTFTCVKSKELSPIHDLPFSPSQFLNSPVITSVNCETLTSTPLGKKILCDSSVTDAGQLTSVLDNSVYQTPNFRGILLPQTPTPIKNAFLEFEGKRNHECRSFHFNTSGRLIEDVDDIIKLENASLCYRGLNSSEKKNKKVIEITPDSTPSSMVTRSRSLLNKAFQQMHSMRNRPNKGHFKARMQISFDEIGVISSAEKKPKVERSTITLKNVVCGRTRDQREMTQLAKRWLRSTKLESSFSH